MADGSNWDMPKASVDGLLNYKKLVKVEALAAKAVKPHDDRGTLDPEMSSHSHSNCVDCLALHECTRENVFNVCCSRVY